MKLRSPAKVNLFLNVLSRRKDGYHEIDTLFERIDLCDEIILKPAARGIRLKCPRSLPTGQKNLAFQAAKILQNEFSIRKGVEIRIRKRIPVAAGLGGGSSNAATVLLGLAHLWKIRCSTKKLMALGARIGSDVPFFMMETAFAHATGRGEKLTPIHAPRLKIWHCLVRPGFKVSTREAYEALGASALTPQKGDVRMTLHSIQNGDSKALSGRLTNSLEVTLNKRLTEISEIKKLLMNEGALGALMSGSGSVVFGIFTSKILAHKAAKNLRKRNKTWQVFVASTF